MVLCDQYSLVLEGSKVNKEGMTKEKTKEGKERRRKEKGRGGRGGERGKGRSLSPQKHLFMVTLRSCHVET